MKGYTLGINMWENKDDVPAVLFLIPGLIRQAPEDAPHGAGNYFRFNPFSTTPDPWNYAPDYVANTHADVDAVASDPVFAKVFGSRPIWKDFPHYLGFGLFRRIKTRWMDRVRKFKQSSETPPGASVATLQAWRGLVSEWLPSLGELVWIEFDNVGWYGYAPDSLLDDAEIAVSLKVFNDIGLHDNALVQAQIEYVRNGIKPTKLLPGFPPAMQEDYENAEMTEAELVEERASEGA